MHAKPLYIKYQTLQCASFWVRHLWIDQYYFVLVLGEDKESRAGLPCPCPKSALSKSLLGSGNDMVLQPFG
jgi:hypothetical protein